MINSFKVLDVKLDALEIVEVIKEIEQWINHPNPQAGKYICVTNVNSVVEAQKDPYLKQIANESDLSVCDGMPLVWLGRLKGLELKKRVYGLNLMKNTLELSQKKGYANYFYGSSEKVLNNMINKIKKEYPNLKITGYFSPPFRDLSKTEKQAITENINSLKPDIIWVGLGYPKQEKWMYEFRDHIRCPVLIGVGAAFDFFSGNKKQAPVWMQNTGLEWLFRLLQEPKRLWRRYLINNTMFIILLIKQGLTHLFFKRRELR
ncbi:MAG: WecB/TagA/CpsF family glycosyltransferase [Candidatus Omnitrophica bacterium]|nr:WecB/TagA/CpsF family glycosyltransferase [Candidatus Omnitrophota bacterium]MDD5352361.1 WecB/TagA/CpsF family glycosyltransferase [Candidatus Omnitrophota bacterium]MDD5549959.1 WecB/TagA/CpsF family glycosyltransferase [Candidatus Omnitrophota bacterium]